jgi:5-formyltetrahydrofolate cyclo-ligase
MTNLHSLAIDFSTEAPTSDELFKAKKALRLQIRHQRKQKSRFQQYSASVKLLQQLTQQSWFKNSKHIALYLANDGEIDCAPIIQLLQRQHKKVYLPVLHPINHRQLFMIEFDQHTPMRYNRFGIKEPQLKRSRITPIERLNLILMPLVGFDRQGNRLGMGGGFYDTTLEKVVNQRWRKSPIRVGVAHNCQEVELLPTEPWDIPLHAIITPTNIIQPKTR